MYAGCSHWFQQSILHWNEVVVPFLSMTSDLWLRSVKETSVVLRHKFLFQFCWFNQTLINRVTLFFQSPITVFLRRFQSAYYNGRYRWKRLHSSPLYCQVIYQSSWINEITTMIKVKFYSTNIAGILIIRSWNDSLGIQNVISII